MIGKQTKGTSFSGCVCYVLREDKPKLLEAVGVEGTPEQMDEQFELQTLLNDKVKNTVGHISLSFLCTATLPRSRNRNCRNLCGSSRSMHHGMVTSISGLRIIHGSTKCWDSDIFCQSKILFLLINSSTDIPMEKCRRSS
ncbi:Relaxase/Mobilisation nuclease domain-containing protein [Parabacteroides chinchillae]|uniref:Relaxase/Mobilisation nuclease domain-containing protein n=1 Tax=Parabacteroides chinchillae TaxID=871327 RepID=A0A8G2BX85_9BACT|nr:Relaxase/Mobilisation nuclease domain-containing protein [Parabacteroides chinchillae]